MQTARNMLSKFSHVHCLLVKMNGTDVLFTKVLMNFYHSSFEPLWRWVHWKNKR